jgi:colanic acid biosynthesis glycosyl transferase WcaI
MRIAIHSQYYPPEMGAPQARLSELAKWLVRGGHEVFILTAMPNYPKGRIYPGYGGLFRREEAEGASIIRTYIYPTKSTRMPLRLLQYFSFLFSSLIFGTLALPKVDYLLTETPPIFLGMAGWLLAKFKGARWVLNVSDLWLESVKDFGLLGEKDFTYRLFRRMSRFLYREAWLVTGQSMEILSEIKRQVPSARLHHLSNGADPSLFHPRRREQKIRERYLKAGEVGFGYAGLHGFFQGLEQILLAADRLRAEPVRFLLFGDGPEREKLISLAHQLKLMNVDFHPPVSHDHVASIIASLDVAVIPLRGTVHGSVPSKIYEAMASGIPILLVANGEAGEIVRGSRAGVAVAPGDIEKLVSNIRELASRPGWRREMGEAGRQAAENHYDRSRIAQRFEAVLLGREKQGKADPVGAIHKSPLLGL